jgi:ribose transport system substrate-binding protein
MRSWCAAVLGLWMLAGCNHTATDGENSATVNKNKGQTLRIAVIPKGTTHEFWRSVHAGAKQAADEAGNVEVLWKGPLHEDDLGGQINIVDDFRVQQVDGICLAPLESQGLIAPVQAAKNDGIPTVIFDSALDKPDLAVAYVATDNYQGGVLAAERLAEVLGGKGGVILMRYNPGSESTYQREEGFLATLKQKHPEINILSSDQYAGGTPENALDMCQQMLLKYRDKVDGVFTVCESNNTGMLGALENEDLAGKVHFIAFDPNARLIQALSDGKVDGIVLQDPVNMGYLAVKTIVDHLRGHEVEPTVNTGEFVATPDNVHEPEMEKLLHPVKFGD